MPLIERVLTIVIVVFGTMFTRFISFMIFPEGKRVPVYIIRLGRVLPYSMMGLLVVYSMKNVLIKENLLAGNHGIAELISVIFIILLQKWKKNMLLSILLGTVFYMFLVQKIFVHIYM